MRNVIVLRFFYSLRGGAAFRDLSVLSVFTFLKPRGGFIRNHARVFFFSRSRVRVFFIVSFISVLFSTSE